MVSLDKSKKGLMAHGKQITSPSGIHRAVVLCFVVILVWQFSAISAFSAVVTSSAKQYQIREEVALNKQPVPTPPDFALMYLQQGLRYYDLGRWQEAIVAFRDATVIKPDYAVAYFGLGTAYSRLEIWEKALASFRMAVEIDPNYAEGYLGLGISYGILGFNSEAINALKMAVQIRPGYVEAHYALALGYLMLSDKAAALKEYGILKTLDPNLADQLINLIKK
jgi:superkiller protein 3